MEDLLKLESIVANEVVEALECNQYFDVIHKQQIQAKSAYLIELKKDLEFLKVASSTIQCTSQPMFINSIQIFKKHRLKLKERSPL